MSLILKIFPYANAEIVSATVICFFMTLLGLSLGFALLKIQGEQLIFNNNIINIIIKYLYFYNVFNTSGTDETRTRNFRRDRAVL